MSALPDAGAQSDVVLGTARIREPRPFADADASFLHSMLRLALKMLDGDVAKFVVLLGGLTFCALLMTQQSGVFCGLMRWTTSTLRNIKVPIWVCDAKVEQVDEVVPLRDIEVNRVRSVEGVDWAVPLYWGIIQARLRDGAFQPVQLTGIDSSTMVGRPARMTAGNIEDLRLPNAVIVDQIAIKKFKRKGFDLKIGDTFEINDKEARVVGICHAEQSAARPSYDSRAARGPNPPGEYACRRIRIAHHAGATDASRPGRTAPAPRGHR